MGMNKSPRATAYWRSKRPWRRSNHPRWLKNYGPVWILSGSNSRMRTAPNLIKGGDKMNDIPEGEELLKAFPEWGEEEEALWLELFQEFCLALIGARLILRQWEKESRDSRTVIDSRHAGEKS